MYSSRVLAICVNLERREEAVVDTLLQGIGVDRVTEVARRCQRSLPDCGVAVRPSWAAEREVLHDGTP